MILKAEHQSKLVAQKSGRQTTRSSHCSKSRRVRGTDAVILGPRKASFVECAVHYFMKFMRKYRVEIYSAGGWAAGTPISLVGYTQDGTHGSPWFIGRVLMGSGGGWRRTPEPTNNACFRADFLCCSMPVLDFGRSQTLSLLRHPGPWERRLSALRCSPTSLPLSLAPEGKTLPELTSLLWRSR